MGTEVETKKAGELLSIALADLIPTKDNPRKIDPKDGSIAELAKSLQEEGQLVPAIARPHPKKKGKFDLRAGHRRLIAARKAGLPALLVIVRDLSDQQALEVTVTENLQREDLTVMEEAAGIQTLLDGGWKTEDIAGNIGKAPEWVLRRARLVKLSKTWQTFARGTGKDISLAALEQVAALDPEVQDAFLKKHDRWNLRRATAAEMRKQIAGWTRALKSAPFDTADPSLSPKDGACAACAKRSSHRPGLFDRFDASEKTLAANDRCLDRRCWDRKAKAAVEMQIVGLKEKHGEVVKLRRKTYSWGGTPDLYLVPSSVEVYKTEKKTPDAKLGVVVEGDGLGMQIYVASKRPRSGGRSRAKGTPTPLKERRKRLERRRAVRLIELVRNRLECTEYTWAEERGDALTHSAALAKTYELPEVDLDHGFWKTTSLQNVAALAAAFGADDVRLTGGGWPDYASLLKSQDWGKIGARLWEGVREVLTRMLMEEQRKPSFRDISPADAEEIWALMGGDVAKLRAFVETEIPEPKSWANLNANGTPKKKPAKKAGGKKAPAKGKAKKAKGKKARKNKATAA